MARCSKVPVIGSLSESRLDSPSRPLTVPLLAPFLLAAGVSPCAAFFLSLALRYWLTLLLHSPLFHIHITSKFSTSAYNRHYMPRLMVCFLTVSYLCHTSQFEPLDLSQRQWTHIGSETLFKVSLRSEYVHGP